MARTNAINLKALTEREQKLKKKLSQLRARRRALARSEQERRFRLISELAEKVGLDQVPEAILAQEFERIVAEQRGVAANATSGTDGSADEGRRTWFGKT